MIKYILLMLLHLNLFALSPFSLENIKELNVKVIDKNNFTTKETLEKIKNSVTTHFFNLGIQTDSKNFSNFIVQIQGKKFEENYAVHVTLFIIEESIPIRDKAQETISITYYKDDFFQSSEEKLQGDIYDSAISYLLDDMIAQYKIENE